MTQKPEKQSADERLLENIQSVLKVATMREEILSDYTKTFTALGLVENDAKSAAYTLIGTLYNASTIQIVEKMATHLFRGFRTKDGHSFTEALEKHHWERAEQIYGQIVNDLPPTGSFLDYGCGSGRVASLVTERTALKVTGADIQNFLAPEASAVQYVSLAGHALTLAQKKYDVVLLSTVAHHAEDSESVLAEAARIGRKIILIETFASDDTHDGLLAEWYRIFLNDVLWNRFFNSGNIPVPGTYDTFKGWSDRMRDFGFTLSSSQDFGFDQKMIHVRHQKMVFVQE